MQNQLLQAPQVGTHVMKRLDVQQFVLRPLPHLARPSPAHRKPAQQTSSRRCPSTGSVCCTTCSMQEGDDVQFDADGLPVDGPARATPRSGSRSARAGLGGSSGGSADALAAAAPTAGGDLEAENRLLRSRLQAVESVSAPG